MTHADLQKLLLAANGAAVLVSPRIIEGVIRELYHLPALSWDVPHWKTQVCDRQCLFRHAEQADLELPPEVVLPDSVILIVRPDSDEMSNLERKPLLLKFWRRLFHGRIHLEFESLIKAGQLPEQAIRERIEAIGRTEFEEIRTVLIQDRWLPAHADDRMTYIEFASVYLELRHFAAGLLNNYFPGIRDFAQIEKILDNDIRPVDLFRETKLQGAPDPSGSTDTRTDEFLEVYWRLVRQAQRAEQSKDNVTAAVLLMRAFRISPPTLTNQTRQDAQQQIRQLVERLDAALPKDPKNLEPKSSKETWIENLLPLLERIDQGNRPIEVQALEDLQRLCETAENEVFTLDLLEYFTSLGKRPIKRPLPSQKHVRFVSLLRSFNSKLDEVRLEEVARGKLHGLVKNALQHAESSLRARFGPILRTALEDVGMRPNTPLESVAFEKMIDELLDRLSNYGYLTFAELRDTISRNQLKMPDLTGPEDFFRGDPLVQLDRRLAALLDGVYRPSEFYVRWLQQGTSLLFGTPWGRPLCLYLLLPFGLAWLLLHVLGMFTLKGVKYTVGYEAAPIITMIGEVLEGPVDHKNKPTFPGAEEPPLDPELYYADHMPVVPGLLYWHLGAIAVTGLFVMGLIHSESFRRRILRGLTRLWRGAYWLCFALPRSLIPLATLQAFVRSWVFQLLWFYLIQPAVLVGVLILLVPSARDHLTMAVLYFLSVLLVTSRFGRGMSEAVRDGALELGAMIRDGLLPSLLRYVLYLFNQILESVEYVLYVIDEWLRYRSGGGTTSLVSRTIAGVFWAPIAFILRFYMVVLIEPMINPLKLPISSLAAKVLYPVLGASGLQSTLSGYLEPVLGSYAANAFVAFNILLLPDAVGFLVWEMKENWSLYRANRGANVYPVSVGSHGETIRGLLRPGFHSGTIPRLFNKLRQAERRGFYSKNWSAARFYRHAVEEVEEEIKKYVEREFVAILHRSKEWKEVGIKVFVVLSTNRIRIELNYTGHSQPIEIAIEHHSGWIVGKLTQPNWVEDLTAEQLRSFEACLAYLYRRSDVDIVMEQLNRALPFTPRSVKFLRREMFLWENINHEPILYSLYDNLKNAEQEAELQRVVFGRNPILWSEWLEAWNQDAAGHGHPGLARFQGILVRRRLSMHDQEVTEATIRLRRSPAELAESIKTEGQTTGILKDNHLASTPDSLSIMGEISATTPQENPVPPNAEVNQEPPTN
jgi:hypothetical protein